MASSSSSRRRQGPGGKRREEDPHVKLSKGLSWLLRHEAINEGLEVLAGGWVDVSLILKHKRFTSFTVDDVKSVVEGNDKKRFELREVDTGALQIRACQGHSFKIEEEVDELLLEPIVDPSLYPTVVHGTYTQAWEKIREQGLSKMSRTHIHFAPGLQGEEGVISGFRKNVQLHIYVDIKKAMEDGIKFYKSKNNVILTGGNEEGFLLTKYFTRVTDFKTKKDLLET